MKRKAYLLAMLAVTAAAPAFAGYTHITIDPPGTTSTTALGIDGGNIMGCYNYPGGVGSYDFLYNGSSYATIAAPTNEDVMVGPTAISGENMVGTYIHEDSSVWTCEYNIGTASYTMLPNIPGMSLLVLSATGISGNNIVGHCQDTSNNGYCFLYNGSSYTMLSDPLATGTTYAQGIDGGNIVGYYIDAAGTHMAFFTTAAAILH